MGDRGPLEPATRDGVGAAVGGRRATGGVFMTVTLVADALSLSSAAEPNPGRIA